MKKIGKIQYISTIFIYFHGNFPPKNLSLLSTSAPQLLLLAPPTFKTNSSTKQRAVMNLSHSTIGKKGFNM